MGDFGSGPLLDPTPDLKITADGMLGAIHNLSVEVE